MWRLILEICLIPQVFYLLKSDLFYIRSVYYDKIFGTARQNIQKNTMPAFLKKLKKKV